MLEANSLKIIELLIEKPLSKKEVIATLNLTNRQLQYAVEKIDSYLTHHDMVPTIQDTKYITLNDESRTFFLNSILNNELNKSYYLMQEERQKYLFLLLFFHVNQPLSMKCLTDVLEIGKTTLMNDIKKLEQDLEIKNIKINHSKKEGYHLSGDELTIRNYLMKMIIEDFVHPTGRFIYDIFFEKEKIEINTYTDNVEKQLIKHDIQLIENRKQEFIYTFILLLPRLKKESLNQQLKYDFQELYSMDDYQFSIDLLESEKCFHTNAYLYLTAWILGISIGNADVDTPDRTNILELVEVIVKRFELFSGMNFENRHDVIQKIYSHFRSAYYRLLFNLPIVNPLSKKIEEGYNEVYLIVKEILKPIEFLIENTIPKEEIAFLTIHFIAILGKINARQKNQIVAIIVCPHGIGSSSIAYNELKTIFPEILFLGPVETSELYQLDYSYDVIFSTVRNLSLYTLNKPIFLINPILSPSEKYNLFRKVYLELNDATFSIPKVDNILSIIDRHADITDKQLLKDELSDYLYTVPDHKKITLATKKLKLFDLLHDDSIQLQVQANRWEEALYLSSLPLLEKKYITRNYIEKIIQTVKNEGPYMLISKNVALSHASPKDGVNQNCLSITVLSDPITIGTHSNNPVKYIFTLAVTNQNSHLHAMSELVKLLSDQNFYTLLNKANQPNQVIDWIKEKLYLPV